MLKDMINYLLDTSFPPLHVPKIEDKDDLSATASQVFTALVHNLCSKPIGNPLDFTSVDDYLSKTLVTKLEITNIEEGYEPMSLLDLCELKALLEPPLQDEKVDFSGWFDSSQKRSQQDGSELQTSIHELPEISKIGFSDLPTPRQERSNNFHKSRLYGLSLNERVRGSQFPPTPQNNTSEYPEWNFGEEFANGEPPASTLFKMSPPSSTYNGSLHKAMESSPTTPAQLFTTSPRNGHSSSMRQTNEFHPHGNIYSPMEQSQDLCNRGKSLQLFQRNHSTSIQSNAFHVSGPGFFESDIVQFSSTYTCGLHVNERVFRPLSLKHVQSDNTRTLSDLLDKYSMKLGDTENFGMINPASSSIPTHRITNSNYPRVDCYKRPIICTPSEEELFSMVTSIIDNNGFSCRIFQIEERWAAERTLALCMSECGYMNEYLMDAYVKMILFNQKMNDKNGVKIGFLKHITYSEISVFFF